ncbi:MAG: hypothetical protein V3T71_00865, partial [Dehalococcoidia bacterium]
MKFDGKVRIVTDASKGIAGRWLLPALGKGFQVHLTCIGKSLLQGVRADFPCDERPQPSVVFKG